MTKIFCFKPQHSSTAPLWHSPNKRSFLWLYGWRACLCLSKHLFFFFFLLDSVHIPTGTAIKIWLYMIFCLCSVQLSALTAEDVVHILSCSRSSNSSGSRAVWKLLLSTVSQVLDQTLELLANTVSAASISVQMYKKAYNKDKYMLRKPTEIVSLMVSYDFGKCFYNLHL